MDLKSRFGSGEHIQLSHQSMTWLEKSTKPKQATFGGIGGGKPPEVTWEDGCACIGMLGEPNPHDTPDSVRRRKATKALCELLVWGSTKDTETNMRIIEQHLASIMFVACQERKQGEPRGVGLTLKDLTGKMARMVLWHELYNMWDWHTVEGMLRYSGIHQLSPKAYSMTWKPYASVMLEELAAMCKLIDGHVISYRRELRDEIYALDEA